MDVGFLDWPMAIRCLGEDDTEDKEGFATRLNLQLTLQQELYTFFGTQPIDDIKKYLLFIPKGSIFFHGDNIHEGEMLYTKLEIPEKKTLFTDDEKEYYQYRLFKQTISIDGPVIKIKTKMENSDTEIINTITQASALLSKASNLRLVSNIKNSLEEIKKGLEKSHDTLNLCTEIEKTLDFLYNTSEAGLVKKKEQGYIIFDQTWAESTNNDRYLHKTNNNLYLTKELLTTEETNLNSKIDHFCKNNKNNEKQIRQFYVNCKDYFTLISKPQDEFLKPPAKTQFFGNPCCETNIALFKGSSSANAKTDAKYLYSMQIYMFQNDIYLLDYWKLSRIFEYNRTFFKKTIALGSRATGLNKRSMFWIDYFKGIVDNSKDGPGMFTYPFEIKPDINITKHHTYSETKYTKLTENYDNYNSKYTYKLRNYHPKEDSPVITHLNYILNLRGFSINIQGCTDFDNAESYIIPNYRHPRVFNLFRNKEVIGRTNLGMICREYTIYNSPKNLLYLCYSSTLPNYSSRSQTTYKNFETYFMPKIGKPSKLTIDKQLELTEVNNKLSDEDGEMFIDFTHYSLFNPNKIYTKNSVNIFHNKFDFGKNKLKIIPKKYTNPYVNRIPQKNYPQFIDLQNMLDDFQVRKNIYITILKKLSNIKYTDENNQKWYLSLINNEVFDKTPLNYFKGLKLIFVSKNHLPLKQYCITMDENLDRAHFKELSELNFSNLINNVNSGKIDNFQNNRFLPFDGGNTFMLDVKIQKEVIKQHDIKDYAHTHLDGALFELIRYNYNCPNNWENMANKMTAPERKLCTDIASKISTSKDPVIEKIIELKPSTACSNENKNACMKRINTLVNLYNENSDLINVDNVIVDNEMMI